MEIEQFHNDFDTLSEWNKETFMIDFELGRRYFVSINRFPKEPKPDVHEYFLHRRYKDFNTNQLLLIRNELNHRILEQYKKWTQPNYSK